eukprot:s1711_g5.t2
MEARAAKFEDPSGKDSCTLNPKPLYSFWDVSFQQTLTPELCRQPFLLDIASWLAVMSEAPSQRKAGWLDSDQDTQTKANYILDPEQEVFNPTIAILGHSQTTAGSSGLDILD